MSRWLAAIFTGLLFAGLLPAKQAFADAPTHVRANYKISKGGITIGTVEEYFARTGDQYRITSITQTTGPLAWLLRDRLTITSEGRIGPTGPAAALH